MLLLLLCVALMGLPSVLAAIFLNESSDLRFFIYDWPHMIDRYANYSDRPHHGHGVEFPQWRQNFGAGRVLNAELHEYKTSQFALFKLMYERALMDPRRTLRPEEATSFLIPYDFGMDACFFETHGRMRKTQCPIAHEAMRLLRNSSYFHRKYGHDHTLIVSVNQNMNYFFGAAMCTSFLHFCWNCTKLAIDDYMFMATDRRFELKNRGINWHAVPFPSDYHFDANVSSAPPWLEPLPANNLSGNRSWVVSFVGNTRKFSEVNTKVRTALAEQCQNHTQHCTTAQYQHSGEMAQHSPNAVSRNSTFCLQPPGDMPTRKAVFDAVLSGCIPVLFHPMTARYMYEWHLGQVGWEEIGLHFDTVRENEDIIAHRLDVVERLIYLYENNQSLIISKQQRIRELAHQLQLSKISIDVQTGEKSVSILHVEELRNHYGVDFSRVVACGNESSKRLADAYDVSMDHVLRIHAGLLSHDRVSHYLSCQTIKRRVQTSDYCSSTGSNKDPYYPPAVRSALYH